MEEEKDLYIRLFYPLNEEQEKIVWEIWMENLGSDIYYRKKIIKNYCDRIDNNGNKCDFMMALFYIYKKIRAQFLCFYYKPEYENEYSYFDYYPLEVFLEERIAYFLNNSLLSDDEKIKIRKEIFDIINEQGEYNDITTTFSDHMYFSYLHIYFISRNRVEADGNNLSHHIKELSNERQQNPKDYIEDTLNTPIEIPNFNSFKLEKNMYLLYNPKSSEEEIKEPANENIEQEKRGSDIILKLGCYDAKRTRELYDECCNVVFKYCKLEDFVNSLNNPDECNLVVIKKSHLYVLYKFFDNIFGEEGAEKIEKLNEKFNIKQSTCSRKNSSYEKLNPTLKKFYNILVEI